MNGEQPTDDLPEVPATLAPDEELVVAGEPVLEAEPLPEEAETEPTSGFELEPRLEQAAAFADKEIHTLADRAVQRIQELGNDPRAYGRARSVFMRSMRGTALSLAVLAAGAGMKPAAAEAGERGEGRRKAAEIASVVLWEGNAELERAYYEDMADLQNMEYAWEQVESEKRAALEHLRMLDQDIALAERNAEASKKANDADGVFNALEHRARLKAEQERIHLRMQDRISFQKALERRMEEKDKSQSKKRKLGLGARILGRAVQILGH